MQRLAVRLIEQRDPEDAMVLGDALQERGIDALITGRSRPVLFRTSTGSLPRMFASGVMSSQLFRRIMSRDEQSAIQRTRTTWPTFVVQGHEAIYNVGRYAAKPDEERWGRIWTMWITSRRATYRALVDAQVLPPSVRFRELEWRDRLSSHLDAALAYDLSLVRVPPRRKKPISAYLFSTVRRDDDNPRTLGQHFSDEG